MLSLAIDRKYPLYLYGNNCIQNSRYYISNYPRFGTPFDIQRTPIARGIGSTVANKKEQEKTISINAFVTDLTNLTESDYNFKQQFSIENYKRIISYSDRYLRIMPYDSYVVLHNPSSTSGWSLSSEGSNLSLDKSDFQLESSSLKFDSSSAGAGFVTISSTTQPSVDLSTYLPDNTLYLPQFERWVFIPDETEITSIDTGIGSSSANYYERLGITTNYEGKPLEQGWNYISVPFTTVTTTGTPTNSSLGSYQYVRFNYSTTSPSLTSFRIDGLLLTSDANVRNYRCYRSGEIDISDSLAVEAGIQIPVKFSLLNYTGYAEGTQTETLFTVAGVAGLSNTQTVTLAGNRELLPTLSLGLNSVINLNQLKLTNVNNNQFIYFTNSWVAGDNLLIDNYNKVVTRNGQAQDFINGKLPAFKPGRNKVKLEVIQSSNTLIQQTSSNAEEMIGAGSPDYYQLAQSFTATVSGTLQSVSLYMRAANVQASNFTPYLIICSDFSGSPGSVLASYNSLTINNSSSHSWIDFPFSVAITSGTKYWIKLTYVVQSDTPPAYSVGLAYWAYQNTDVYASNYRSRRFLSSPTWSNQAGNDHAFKVSIAPVPSTSVDWNMNYKRLYN